MKLEKIILIGLIALTLATTFAGCKKYPDGPEFSLRTRASRVANTWKVENYKINGSDFTSLVSSYTETFSKNKSYSYSWGILDGSGTWAFQNKDAEIKLTGNDNQSSHTLTILKLEEKTFWYYYMNGNDKYELHLIQK